MAEDANDEAKKPAVYGIRLRFRTNKGLTTGESSLTFTLDGHEVSLASPDEKPLRDGGWFSLKATGFSSAEEAEAFGRRLRTALQVASIRRVWGVDVGEDKPTAALGKSIVDQMAKDNVFVRANVHGLDVFEDKPGTYWFGMSAKGTVSTDPEKLFGDVGELLGKVAGDEPENFDAVRLLNEALISQEAAAQLVLAIAAVEMLAQGGDWTPEQRGALERLAASAENDEALPEEQRTEVADAVRRSYRFGVMEGFRRLLRSLGLFDLWPDWKELYGGRSKLLHGLAYAPPGDRSAMVMPALLLSSRIVLTALEADIPGAAKDFQK